MDPATLDLIVRLAPLAFDVVDGLVRPKSAYTPGEIAQIESAYEESVSRRRALSDRLRSTPDDLG